MTFHALIEYLKYRWRARGRHGIHSPFVYDFVEKGLQGKISRTQGAPARHPQIPEAAIEDNELYRRIYAYFGIRNLAYISHGEQGVWLSSYAVHASGGHHYLQLRREDSLALRGFRAGTADEPPYVPQLLKYVFPPPSLQDISRLIFPDSIILIDNIHQRAAATVAWNRLRQSPEVRLSIDLYDAGLLFFRDELLVKQHFVVKH